MKELIKTLDEIWRFYANDKQFLIEFFRSDYKHFDKKAKRKEADEMERELSLKRKAVEQIKSLLSPIPKDKLDEIKDELARDIKGWFVRWRSQYPEEDRDIDELPHQNAKNIISILLKKYDELKEKQ